MNYSFAGTYPKFIEIFLLIKERLASSLSLSRYDRVHKFATDERDKRDAFEQYVSRFNNLYRTYETIGFYLCIPMGVRVTQCSVIPITASILKGTICVPGERKRIEEIRATDVIARINLNII